MNEHRHQWRQYAHGGYGVVHSRVVDRHRATRYQYTKTMGSGAPPLFLLVLDRY